MPKFQTQSLRLSDQHRKSHLWRGIVSITLIEGRDLKAMDSNGLSDPYVKFRLGHQKYKSKVSLHPSVLLSLLGRFWPVTSQTLGDVNVECLLKWELWNMPESKAGWWSGCQVAWSEPPCSSSVSSSSTQDPTLSTVVTFKRKQNKTKK